MMNNAWKLNEGDKTYGKAWSNTDDDSKSSPAKLAAKRASPAKQGQTSQGGQGKGAEGGSDLDKALNKLRTKLAQRGARGFVGMQRQFKIMDDDMSGAIEMPEFVKAMRDFRIDLNQQELNIVFEAFDRDSSGAINYDEFVRGVRGPMNNFRKKIVMQAFKKIDKDGSGVLEMNDIKVSYNAKLHPDVKSGKKTEDEILGEFLETFEAHHAMNGGTRDQRVTPEEFVEYYTNISASIDNDEYFELMMINSWKLYGEAPRKPAWSNLSGKSE